MKLVLASPMIQSRKVMWANNDCIYIFEDFMIKRGKLRGKKSIKEFKYKGRMDHEDPCD